MTHPDQLEMPMPKQVRRIRPESLSLHEAALVLRAAGYRVYRSGRTMHLVDGRRVPSMTVKEMARAIERGAE